MLTPIKINLQIKFHMIAETRINEEGILYKYGFLPTNYNGISVYYNPKLSYHFYKEKGRKSKIVLHHTAGSFEGDLITLLGKNKVSTAFLISPEGRIIMLFHPWNWAWHLGKGALGGNEIQSRKSIGIEISNWGYLIPKGEYLYTYSGVPFCKLSDLDQYEVLEEGKIINYVTGEKAKYYAKYSEEQYESVNNLVRKLCQLYAIPYKRWAKGYDDGVITFNGITTHTDFRKDKFDLSPTFKWFKLNL